MNSGDYFKVKFTYLLQNKRHFIRIFTKASVIPKVNRTKNDLFLSISSSDT